MWALPKQFRLRLLFLKSVGTYKDKQEKKNGYSNFLFVEIFFSRSSRSDNETNTTGAYISVMKIGTYIYIHIHVIMYGVPYKHGPDLRLRHISKRKNIARIYIQPEPYMWSCGSIKLFKYRGVQYIIFSWLVRIENYLYEIHLISQRLYFIFVINSIYFPYSDNSLNFFSAVTRFSDIFFTLTSVTRDHDFLYYNTVSKWFYFDFTVQNNVFFIIRYVFCCRTFSAHRHHHHTRRPGK